MGWFILKFIKILSEACDRTSKNNYSRLLIKKRPADGIYFCQLSLKPHQPSSQSSSDLTNTNNLDTEFKLGLIGDAEKYIQQYVKIFSEDGRRPVTIKHNVLHHQQQQQQQQQFSQTSIGNFFKNFFFPFINSIWLMSKNLKPHQTQTRLKILERYSRLLNSNSSQIISIIIEA